MEGEGGGLEERSSSKGGLRLENESRISGEDGKRGSWGRKGGRVKMFDGGAGDGGQRRASQPMTGSGVNFCQHRHHVAVELVFVCFQSSQI